MLVHVTLNTGESQCVAVVAENFDPAAMVQLCESLPKVPGGGQAYFFIALRKHSSAARTRICFQWTMTQPRFFLPAQELGVGRC